ncbi:hypothetical protein ACL02O_31625 [Micromonospora sp. MS34]|uniref:hypothetical protein n=1 Tax=Micromonospora sp. MS34 TaxID=3385971 RepID=UPI0039A13A00
MTGEGRESGRVAPCCPRCGSDGVPLVYGLPGPAAREAARAGRIALGGCRVSTDPARWTCVRRHRWPEPDLRRWEAALDAAMSAEDR